MRYRFSQCILDVDRHELYRQGDSVAVEPQVFDLIHLLVQNAGKLVTHDRIVNEIWDGRSISDSAISSRITTARKAVGDNGKEQTIIKTVPRRGLQFVAKVHFDQETDTRVSSQGPNHRQVIRYTTSPDGSQLAYAAFGSGPKIMRAGHFLTHLEKDWHSPIWRPYLDALGQNHTVLRYDQRGTGLSSWELGDTSLEAYSADLKSVADAAGLERFPLIASSQGVPVAIHFAANNPDRVERLILYGGYALGRTLRNDGRSSEEASALLAMIRAGWGKPDSAFMTGFTSVFCPGATPEEIANLVDIQLASTTPENAVNIRVAIDRFSVVDDLDKIEAPTLVIHAQNDSLHPASQGQLIASRIPGAEYMQVQSDNHIVLPSDPAFAEIIDATLEFLTRKTRP